MKNSLLLKEQCVIQLINITKQKSISFTGNVAVRAGNSIYAYPLFSCLVRHKLYNNTELLDFYENHFHFIDNKEVFELHIISTSASKLTLCYPNGTHSNSINFFNTYPGQKIKIYMASIDALNRNVYSSVAVNLDKENELNQYIKEQVIIEGDKCTSFGLRLYVIENIERKLVFSLPSFSAALVVNVIVQLYPLGFIWHNEKHQCVCSPAFYNKDFYLVSGYKADCDINYLSIVRPNLYVNTWAGNMNMSTHFGVSIQCPLGYCNGNGSFFAVIKLVYIFQRIILVKLMTHCVYIIDVGPLCGSCNRLKEGQKLSVIFGSTECRQCSNWWLWTLVLYAVAGPLLIYLLFALRLTLTTGTFNGIIFYAQAANVGILEMLTIYNGNNRVLKNILIVLLSFLNLGLGFPLCFYNRMTSY